MQAYELLNQKNYKTAIIVILCFLLLSVTILFLPSKSQAYAFKSITSNTASQANSDIFGNKIVWRDYRDGGDGDIYLYDISTGTETAITNDAALQWNPKISGNQIVWQGSNYGSWDIYYYDLSTNTLSRITTLSSDQTNPDISGNRIVWVDARYGATTRDIYMYNLTGATTTRITGPGSTADVGEPSISGSKIIWQDRRSGNWDIYMYDVYSSIEYQLTSNFRDQIIPAINESANRIIWTDYRNTNADIYSYSISNNTTSRLTTNTGNQTYSAISGNSVVYQDDRNGNFDIYSYNLSSNSETRLILNSRDQHSPQISGDKIALTHWTPTNSDIGLFDIQSPVTVSVIAPASPNGTNGWYKTTPLVALARSEVGSTAYAFSSTGPWSVYNSPISIPEGEKTLYYLSRDFAGNYDTIRTRNVKVDTTKPVTTIRTYPSVPSNGWFNQIPLIRMLTSETAANYFSFVSSNGPWRTYSDLFYSPSGKNTLYYYSIDRAGNIETTQNQVIKIRPNAPLAKINTKLTLKKKYKAKKVKQNRKVIFTGRLIDSQKIAVKNKRIAIKSKVLKRVRKRVGKRTRVVKKYVWVNIKLAKTNKKGEFKFSLKFKKLLIIKASFGGTRVYKPSSSKGVKLS